VALMTIEGEKDDITGLGQCRAAHDLCTGIPADRKVHFECPRVGHYGVFNGSRFRHEIAPRIAEFTRAHDGRTARGVMRPPVERRRTGTAEREQRAEVDGAAFTFAPVSSTHHPD
jgi:poly(3-hydroxybutyrate) depolymerase